VEKKIIHRQLIVFNIVEGFSIGAVGSGVALYASRGFQGFYVMTVPVNAPSATIYALARGDDYHSPSVDCFDACVKPFGTRSCKLCTKE
jgi:hypothetical protein